MAGFGEIFGMGGEADFRHPIARGQDGMSSIGKPLMDFRGNPLFGGDKGNPMGQGSSSMNEARAAGALTPADDSMSMETMGAIMGTAQALSGLVGQFDASKNMRSALKIQQIQNNINARFAKSNFGRRMTALIQKGRDIEEQSMQQHTQREAAYQRQMGSMKVIQAERGMAGTSATETKDALTRSNLLAEHIQLNNLRKTQRSLMYEREGLYEQRLAEEAGFDMSNANIAAQLQTPTWAQILAGAPDLAIGGFNTYFNFVRDTGRNDSVT